VKEMAYALGRELLDLWERGAQEVGHLHPQRLGLGAQDGEDGSTDGGCLLWPEVPLVSAGNSTPKKVSASSTA
jgi:hypothetical protein